MEDHVRVKVDEIPWADMLDKLNRARTEIDQAINWIQKLQHDHAKGFISAAQFEVVKHHSAVAAGLTGHVASAKLPENPYGAPLVSTRPKG